jgi:hypothetical protein
MRHLLSKGLQVRVGTGRYGTSYCTVQYNITRAAAVAAFPSEHAFHRLAR